MATTLTAQPETMSISLPLDKHRRSVSEVRESELIPPYFTQAQLGKLEDKFTQRKWPDEFTIQMIALECNMLERHVAVCVANLSHAISH